MNSLRHQKNSMAQNRPCATECPRWRTNGAISVQNSAKARSRGAFQAAPPASPQWRISGTTRNAPPPPPALYRNGGASGAHHHPISAGPKVGRRCREQHPARARGLALFQKHTAAAAAAITKQPSARSELSPWKIRDSLYEPYAPPAEERRPALNLHRLNNAINRTTQMSSWMRLKGSQRRAKHD